MSKNIKLATLSVAVVAGLFVAHWGGYQTAQIAEPTADIAHFVTDAPALAQTTRPQMSSEIPTINLDLAAWEAEYTAPVEAEERAYIARYEAQGVLPYNPEYMDCTDVVFVATDSSESGSNACKTYFKYPRHPYYEYENAALESLAYGDPLAALLLSQRYATKQPEKSLGLALHSAAISAKPGPLQIATHNTFDIYNPKRELSPEDMFYHAALLRIAKKMGAKFGMTDLNLPEGKTISEEPLNKLVKDIEAQLIQTQITVTGGSSLRELFDAQ